MEIWKDPKIIVLWILGTIVIFFIILLFMTLLLRLSFKKVFEKKEAVYNEKIENEKNLAKAMIDIQDQERKEIASEIHDQISNKLNLIVMVLSGYKNADDLEIKNIRQEIKDLIQKNRDISHYLFPIEIENIGLIYTLQDLSYKFQTINFTIQVYFKEHIDFKDKTTELQLYRVIQESLSNVIKHSEASKFYIQFKKFNTKIGVIIADNGKGFDIEKANKGLGFHTMDTRLKTINAVFKYKSAPNKGTRLIIVL